MRQYRQIWNLSAVPVVESGVKLNYIGHPSAGWGRPCSMLSNGCQKGFKLEVHAFAGPSLGPEWSLNGTYYIYIIYIFERTCQVGSEDNSKTIPFRRASDCFSFLHTRESYSITASYCIIFDISTILKKFLLHRPTCFQRPPNCTASSSFNARTMSL